MKIRFLRHVAGFVQGIFSWLRVLRARLNEDFDGKIPSDVSLLVNHLSWSQLRRLQHPDGTAESLEAEEDDCGDGKDTNEGDISQIKRDQDDNLSREKKEEEGSTSLVNKKMTNENPDVRTAATNEDESTLR